MRKLTKFDVASLRAQAQIIAKEFVNKNKVQTQIDKLEEELRKRFGEKKQELEDELKSIDARIDAINATAKVFTEGYQIEDLFNIEFVDSGKLSKAGVPLKTTKIELKYPDTITPPDTVSSEVKPEEDLPYCGELPQEAADETEPQQGEQTEPTESEPATVNDDLPFGNPSESEKEDNHDEEMMNKLKDEFDLEPDTNELPFGDNDKEEEAEEDTDSDPWDL